MKNKKRNQKFKYLLIILLGITLGYALLTVNLKIDGLGRINSMKFDVHWGNAKVTDGSVVKKSPKIDSARTTATFEFELHGPGNFYEFTIDAINSGGKDAMITSIDNKVYEEDGETIATLPEYIHYSVTYADGSPIAVNHKLTAGTKKKYKVRIEYDPNTDESPDENIYYVAELKVTYGEANNNAIDVGSEDLITKVGNKVTIDGTDGSPQVYYIVGEETVDGVDAYALAAEHNISIFATMPGSVQFLQYDQEAAASNLGVDYFYTYDGLCDFDDEYGCAFNYHDYAGWMQSISGGENKEYIYSSSLVNNGPSTIEDTECFFHKETDTGVDYCFNKSYSPAFEETEDEYYSYTYYKSLASLPSEERELKHSAFGGWSFGGDRDEEAFLPLAIEKHKEKVESLGINVLSARLLSYEEAESLSTEIAKVNECFWLGSAYNSSEIYYACGDRGNFYIDHAIGNITDLVGSVGIDYLGLGARPVLLVPKSEID